MKPSSSRGDPGAWHTRWRPLRDLLTSTGSAASWPHECLENLRINETALTANIAGLDDPDLLACGEFVALALEAHG